MHPERGFSLLELLVAASVLAVALLGTGLLATRALHDAASLRDHALAELLFADLRARTDLVGPESLESAARDGGIAALEFQDWQALAHALLPSVSVTLCRVGSASPGDSAPLPCDGFGPLRARLAWRRDAASDPEWRQEAIRP